MRIVVALLIFYLTNLCVCLAGPKTGSLELEDALEMDLEELLALTVTTPSRTLEHIKKTAATVTVITDEQIRQMGARHLSDVLVTVPGLGITLQGAYMENQIEVRGVTKRGSNDLLIMINGHHLNNSHNGGAAAVFDTMMIENVKKIEVIRGPVSAVYGANAFLAVINVITKDWDDLDGVEITAGGGSFGKQQYNLMVGKQINGLNFFFDFNFFDSDGFRGYFDQDRQTIIDGIYGTDTSLAPGYARQGKRKYEFDLNIEYKDFTLKGHYIDKKDHCFPGLFTLDNNETIIKYDDYFLELGYSREFWDDLEISTKVYRNYNQMDVYIVVFPPGHTRESGVFSDGFLSEPYAKNTRHGGEVQLTWDWSESNKAVFGVMGEYQEQFDVGQSANYNPLTLEPLGSFQNVTSIANWNQNASRHLWAVYGEDIWDIKDNLSFTVGARYDRYSDFGGSFNPRTGLVWEFIEGYDIKLLYGRAFRAPVFNEMYNNGPTKAPNPNLDPENVQTLEASIGADITDSISGRITIFQNKITNLIKRNPNPIGSKIKQINSGKAISEGIELEVKKGFDEGSYLAMNYTYQNPKDEDTGRLADVPTHKGNIMANWEINEHFNWYAQLFLKGSTPREDGDTRSDVPGYGIVNTTFIARDFLKGWGEDLELRLSVYNLLDKEYQDPAPVNTLPADYPRPGISAFFEVRYTFN